MPLSELTLATWTRRSSDHEEQKCERAARMIRDALDQHAPLKARRYVVISQGSYENNTNVRNESDVDLCVKFTDVSETDFTYAKGETFASLGLARSDKNYGADRKMVEDALRAKFGSTMTVGNKAFDIHSNQGTRVDADVVAAWGFNGYTRRTGPVTINKGVAFWTRDGRRVVNFPEQHKENGIAKNNRTGKAYKRATRIIKRLRYQMLEDEVASADGVSSFLLECAMYNVPDDHFNQTKWQQVMDQTIHYMIRELRGGSAQEWVEVNCHKWLFKASYGHSSNWQSKQLLDFLVDAARYL